MELGLDLYTHHRVQGELCNDTTGVYVKHNGFAGGITKISNCRTGAWVAWAPETNIATFGNTVVNVGVLLGAIIGYKSMPVVPLVSPGVSFGVPTSVMYRLQYLPKPPKGTSDGIHFSVEFPF